jgi:hypothetical protein
VGRTVEPDRPWAGTDTLYNDLDKQLFRFNATIFGEWSASSFLRVHMVVGGSSSKGFGTELDHISLEEKQHRGY